METYRRIGGLVEYIAGRYANTVEIGVGHFPDVAYALLDRQVNLLATDILSFEYAGLKVVMDDVTAPDFEVYKNTDLLYSMRPPSELVPYMVRLAERISADLIVKPLSSEYLDGQMKMWGDTTFYIWNRRITEKV